MEQLKILNIQIIMQNDYILPNGYLSFSQIMLWESSKESYRKRYYPDIRPEQISNVYMWFGNHVTLAMEKDEDWVKFIPRLSEFEHLFDCTIDGVRLRGAIDQFDYATRHFDEQKTTMTSWSENKIMKHFQLDMYSLVIEHVHGRVDDTCNLLWVGTQKDESEVPSGLSNGQPAISLTGDFKLTPRTISAADRQVARERIVRVAKEIAEDYAAMKHLYNPTDETLQDEIPVS